MKISKLLIQNFRNISYLVFSPSASFNLIYGSNGSGKTSLLETISYLGLGRSFRTSRYQSLIKSDQDFFLINAKVTADRSTFEHNLGIRRRKGRSVPVEIAVDGEHNKRLVDLIDLVCVQAIHPQSYGLVLGEPELRRNFIDWGVYYTYPEFKYLWFDYRKLLFQRNSLLKQKAPDAAIEIWDDHFCSICEKITTFRQEYLANLDSVINEKVARFLPNFKIRISFHQGWENGLQLHSVLHSNLEKDRVLGYTFYGCHRADLKIKSGDYAASETLSRGQLKLLVCAMRLAQGELIFKQHNINCIYLIDDFYSELDEKSRQLLLQDLFECSSQVFLTNISPDLNLPDFNFKEINYFDIAKSIVTDD